MMRTLKQTALEAGITPAFMSMILNGHRNPSWKTAKKLERVTGLPAPDWFERPGDELRAAIKGSLPTAEKG